MREAADILGVSKEAIRKRVVRGTLRSELGEDGRRYVYIDAGGDTATDEAPTHERDVLISEMVEELRDEVHYLREQFNQELARRSAEAERYQQIVAALTTANASLADRLRALEPPEETPLEPRESPETVEEAQDRAEPVPATGGAHEATVRPQERSGWREPGDKLPWWHYVLGLFLVSLAVAVTSNVLHLPFIVGGAIFPALFGLWVGLRQRNLRLWSRIIPFGGLVGLAVIVGEESFRVVEAGIDPSAPYSGALLVAYLAGFLLGTATVEAGLPGWLLFVSGALIGNAWQRRRIRRISGTAPASPMSHATLASPEPSAYWTPRKQAYLGFAGTIIASLISLFATVMSTILASGG
jgi:hypothetical protein